MFKLILLAIVSMLSAPNLSEAGSTTAREGARCVNSRGGTCKVSVWKAGRAKFTTSRRVKTLRFVPPASSGHAPFELTFDGVAKDCNSETTCPNGTKVSCTATGTNAQCQSNATSVGCLTVDDNGENTSGSAATCPGS